MRQTSQVYQLNLLAIPSTQMAQCSRLREMNRAWARLGLGGAVEGAEPQGLPSLF